MKKLWVLVFLVLSGNAWSPVKAAESMKEFYSLQGTQDAILSSSVRFWIKINSEYSTHEGVIHDSKYIDHIYQVLHLKGSRRSFGGQILQARRKWKEVLLSVHRKQSTPEKMSSSEKFVFEMFRDIHEPNKFLNAAHRKRLRFQLGQKDRFLEGLRQSGKYLKKMEEVFEKEGLPQELARIPFVESSFNLKAVSKVGASGIWQFTQSTAQLFIRVDEELDERNDPIRATEAAAKLLKLNYESLGNWPLAVTAYNHGRKRLMRGSSVSGSSDLSTLIHEYRSRSFGFASRNFFAELLAMVELEKNPGQYFSHYERLSPLSFREVQVQTPTQISEITGKFRERESDLRALNPALRVEVWSQLSPVPSGYWFRFPVEL